MRHASEFAVKSVFKHTLRGSRIACGRFVSRSCSNFSLTTIRSRKWRKRSHYSTAGIDWKAQVWGQNAELTWIFYLNLIVPYSSNVRLLRRQNQAASSGAVHKPGASLLVFKWDQWRRQENLPINTSILIVSCGENGACATKDLGFCFDYFWDQANFCIVPQAH